MNPDAGKRPLPAMHQPLTRGRSGAESTAESITESAPGTQDDQTKGDKQ